MKTVKKAKKPVAGAKWLRAVCRDRDLNEEQMELAKKAAAQLDIAELAQAEIDARGLLVRTSHNNMKSNPAVAIARQAGESHAKLARMLRIACEPRRGLGRPPLNQKTWEQLPSQESRKADWNEFGTPKQ